MARSRNIKPGFFTNDELAECHPLGRLLFAGLWTIADKEGRLDDRPKKLKRCFSLLMRLIVTLFFSNSMTINSLSLPGQWGVLHTDIELEEAPKPTLQRSCKRDT
jgi:hypothetical protein